MRAGLGGMLRSEWTKIRSVRSTFWTLLAMVVISLGIMSIITVPEIAHWGTLDADTRDEVASTPCRRF